MSKLPPWAAPAGVALISIAAWSPVLKGAFVNWDDAVLLGAQGWRGLGVDNLAWMLGSRVNGTWQPLAWSVYAALYSLFGLWPPAFHAANLLVHAACAAVLCLILERLSKERAAAALGALLFALHPMQGEIAALSASLADALAALFCLLSVLFLLESRRRACLYAFLAACACRWTALVALPALWLLGLRPEGEKKLEARAAYLAAGVAIAFNAWAKGAAGAATAGSFSPLAAPLAAVELLKRWVWPSGLLPVYPAAAGGVPAAAGLAAALAITVAAWALRRKWPEGAAAWAVLLFACVPPSFSALKEFLPADRYAYLPSAALAGALAIGALRLSRRLPGLALPTAGLGLALSLAGALASRKRCAQFATGEAMWRSVLAAAPSDTLAHTRLASALQIDGRYEEAVAALKDLEKYDPEAARRNLERLKFNELKK